MDNKEKLENIDEVLSQCEDVLHGRLGEEITQARKLIQSLVDSDSLPPVIGQGAQLLAWEKWKVEKGNYPEYRTQEQMMKDYFSQ